MRRRKSRIGLMAVGAALIVGGGLSLGMGGWVNPQHIVGIVLAILGLGMVFGAFVRGGRGLIGLAVPLSLVGIGLTVVGPDGLEGGVHDYDETPHSIAAVQPEYRAAAGSIRLDLTQLPTSGEVETKIDLGVGDVQVILPPNADVTLECSNDLGEARCLNRLHSGPNVDLPKIEDLGEDNKESNLKIDIEVEVGAGDLEVSRG